MAESTRVVLSKPKLPVAVDTGEEAKKEADETEWTQLDDGSPKGKSRRKRRRKRKPKASQSPPNEPLESNDTFMSVKKVVATKPKNHAPSFTKTIYCKWYQQGQCRRGEDCFYIHAADPGGDYRKFREIHTKLRMEKKLERQNAWKSMKPIPLNNNKPVMKQQKFYEEVKMEKNNAQSHIHSNGNGAFKSWNNNATYPRYRTAPPYPPVYARPAPSRQAPPQAHGQPPQIQRPQIPRPQIRPPQIQGQMAPPTVQRPVFPVTQRAVPSARSNPEQRAVPSSRQIVHPSVHTTAHPTARPMAHPTARSGVHATGPRPVPRSNGAHSATHPAMHATAQAPFRPRIQTQPQVSYGTASHGNHMSTHVQGNHVQSNHVSSTHASGHGSPYSGHYTSYSPYTPPRQAQAQFYNKAYSPYTPPTSQQTPTMSSHSSYMVPNQSPQHQMQSPTYSYPSYYPSKGNGNPYAVVNGDDLVDIDDDEEVDGDYEVFQIEDGQIIVVEKDQLYGDDPVYQERKLHNQLHQEYVQNKHYQQPATNGRPNAQHGGGEVYSFGAPVSNIHSTVQVNNNQKKTLAKKQGYSRIARKYQTQGSVSTGTVVSYTDDKKDDNPSLKVCTYFLNGTCQFGPNCRMAHRFPLNFCPNCLEEVGTKSKVQQMHMSKCNEMIYIAKEREESSAAMCGICRENIMESQKRFGILAGCTHAFCLQCLREWRGSISQSKEAVRSCPMCRTPSHFIVPCDRLITDPKRKEKLFEVYKKSLASILCKHYAENQSCPFGTSCFYKHINPDGTVEKVKLRHVVNEDGQVEIMKNVHLSDFLFRSSNQ